MRPWFDQNGDNDFGFNFDDDFFNSLGQPEHDFEQQVLNAQIPANASIEIENPRGDVSVTAGDGSAIEVQAHEVAYAGSDSDAKKIFDAEAAHLTVSGNSGADQVGEQRSRADQSDRHRAQVGARDHQLRQRRRDRGRPGRGHQRHRSRRRSPERDCRLGARRASRTESTIFPSTICRAI